MFFNEIRILIPRALSFLSFSGFTPVFWIKIQRKALETGLCNKCTGESSRNVSLSRRCSKWVSLPGWWCQVKLRLLEQGPRSVKPLGEAKILFPWKPPVMSQQPRGKGSAGNIVSDDDTTAEQGYLIHKRGHNCIIVGETDTQTSTCYSSGTAMRRERDVPLEVPQTGKTEQSDQRTDGGDCCVSANQEERSQRKPTNGTRSCVSKHQNCSRHDFCLHHPEATWRWPTPPLPSGVTAHHLWGAIRGTWQHRRWAKGALHTLHQEVLGVRGLRGPAKPCSLALQELLLHRLEYEIHCSEPIRGNGKWHCGLKT